ncbi:hypothetical protein PR202_gb09778 [Eleusine coracana subsp. coracana]|uniref:Uncharacterized protein n=1 Tax=Eleusine coracana subsp. coracana TaxID=191504 RepID=A0AAV5EFT7_ELECO|nr:hypothetical protein PR202_gb09778 [Eleusine coracana subsp. coracana]
MPPDHGGACNDGGGNAGAGGKDQQRDVEGSAGASGQRGPLLLPDDAAKKQFAKELLAYTTLMSSTKHVSREDVSKETGCDALSFHQLLAVALDKIEAALGKFSDGPFLLDQFSLIFFSNIKNYDITAGRPNLQQFIEEVNKINAYTETKQDPQFVLEHTKKRLGIASS